MEESNFFEQLCNHIDLPFSASEVHSIDSNCGTVWIQLNDGKTFSLAIQLCETDCDEMPNI